MELQIKKLFNKLDYKIFFDKKINILIGENGCGKSTILRILTYLQKRDFISLIKVPFEKIEIKNDNFSETILYSDLVSTFDYRNNHLRKEIYNYFDNYFLLNKKDEKEDFELFYNGLIKIISKYSTHPNIIIDDNFENYIQEDGLFYLGIDFKKDYYNKDFSEREIVVYHYFYQFMENNEACYGSKLYFHNLYKFFYYYYQFKEYSENSTERTSIEYLFYKTFSTRALFDRDDSLLFNQIYIYPKLGDIIGFTTLFDYVKFEENNNNLQKIDNNICFYSDKTFRFIYYDYFLKLLGDKSDHNKKIIELNEYDIEKIRHIFNIFANESKLDFSIDRFLIGSHYLLMHKFNYFEEKNKFNNMKNTLYFDTDGYDYDKLFRFIEKNYTKLLELRDNGKYILFKDLCKKYISDKNIDLDIELENGKRKFILKIKSLRTNRILLYDDLSSGEKKIIRLIKMICFSKEIDTLLLDEPELSLSPYWQELLLDDFSQYCSSNKIIISTQSTNLVNSEYIENIIFIKKDL